jgi:hypothetical protein
VEAHPPFVVSGLSRTLIGVVSLLAAGCHQPQYTQVSATPAGAFEGSLAPLLRQGSGGQAEDGFVTAWYDTRDGHGEIYLRRLDGDGKPIAPERRLTTGTADAYEADITPATIRQSGRATDGVVVGWYEKTKRAELTPKFGAFALDGTAHWVKALSAHGRNTVVRAQGALVFVAWIEDEDNDHSSVWAAWWRADGVPLVPAFAVAPASRTTWNLNAAIDPGSTLGTPRAWLAFDAVAGTRVEEIFVVNVTEAGAQRLQITADDGKASKYPDIAFSGDHVALTWFDSRDGNEEVYLAVGAKGDVLTPAGATPKVVPTRVTNTPGHSIGAYVAWNADRLGLAWCDDSSGNQEVYFQAFDREGRRSGGEQRVTTTEAHSSVPAIKPWRDGFALLWNEYTQAVPEGHGAGQSQVAFRLVR